MTKPTLHETYARPTLHAAWEDVYRSSPLQERFNERLFARIARAVGGDARSMRVLDAGCGTGSHLVRFRRAGYQCVGADLAFYALERARARLRAAGLNGVALCQAPLEALPFPDDHFDVAHCRGVLMHIPDWRAALRQLCRVTRPGGVLVIVEGNSRALEFRIVRLVRALTARRSRVRPTPDGPEFWSEVDRHPFLVRVADQARLAAALEEQGCPVEQRFAAGFWDINRFPGGALRDLAIRFNTLWLACGGPAGPSIGQALVARKRRAAGG